MQFIYPDWPAPKHIKAATTLVASGLNLALTNPKRAEDEQKLCTLLSLPVKPAWLRQIHSNIVVQANDTYMPEADASIANVDAAGNVVCAVLTADCMPILLTDLNGTKIAAIHAGWRSLFSGIIEETINAMDVSASSLLAWFGPAISKDAFEVGSDLYEKAFAILPESLQQVAADKWLLDLFMIGKYKLQQLGVPAGQIYGGKWCTYGEPESFFSYRLNNTDKRMASLIWFTKTT